LCNGRIDKEPQEWSPVLPFSETESVLTGFHISCRDEQAWRAALALPYPDEIQVIVSIRHVKILILR
jgi:hypothetical protein